VKPISPGTIAVLLGLLLADSSALADRPVRVRTLAHPGAATAAPIVAPRVELVVTPLADSFRWRFALRSLADGPVEVAADRNLLWAELAADPAAPVSRAQGRAVRAFRCVGGNRPANTENVHRVIVRRDEPYEEGFDLRDLCGLRLPDTFRPGARVVFHYGYDNSTSASRAVTFDPRPTPLTQLSTESPVSLPAMPGAVPDAPLPEGELAPALQLEVLSHPSASDGDSLSATVRLRRPGVYPLWTMYRLGMLSIEVTAPSGRYDICGTGIREYPPMREFFTRLAGGRSLTRTIRFGGLCGYGALWRAGTYRARAIYRTRADGREFGLNAFVGTIASRPFYFRITRDQNHPRYEPLSTDDPFREAPDGEDSRRR